MYFFLLLFDFLEIYSLYPSLPINALPKKYNDKKVKIKKATKLALDILRLLI